MGRWAKQRRRRRPGAGHEVVWKSRSHTSDPPRVTSLVGGATPAATFGERGGPLRVDDSEVRRAGGLRGAGAAGPGLGCRGTGFCVAPQILERCARSARHQAPHPCNRRGCRCRGARVPKLPRPPTGRGRMSESSGGRVGTEDAPALVVPVTLPPRAPLGRSEGKGRRGAQSLLACMRWRRRECDLDTGMACPRVRQECRPHQGGTAAAQAPRAAGDAAPAHLREAGPSAAPARPMGIRVIGI